MFCFHSRSLFPEFHLSQQIAGHYLMIHTITCTVAISICKHNIHSSELYVCSNVASFAKLILVLHKVVQYIYTYN